MITLPDFITAARAACAQPGTDPDLWHSKDREDRRTAKTICTGCPLLDACRTWALDVRQSEGVWGGLDAAERAALTSGTGWWLDTSGRLRRPCGTLAAHWAHHSYREKCAPCAAAHAAHVEQQRRNQLVIEHLKGGSPRGYDIHRRLEEPACDDCRTAKAAASRASRANAARRRRRPAARAAHAA
ncbi:WhiB family transcriptional regulator [Streptomyces sp. RTd22]|uniref:WhiB family transcriptional regulator n=1 Tax=Streptomyces sp. RTd22 TaxID=1841249 RepID=UPI0007C50EC3|nr:WhiB family transcriptional regulator [Streptomyces sp. RTd22]